jgi:hypothetical protein
MSSDDVRMDGGDRGVPAAFIDGVVGEWLCWCGGRHVDDYAFFFYLQVWCAFERGFVNCTGA